MIPFAYNTDVRHPAKFTPVILDRIRDLLGNYDLGVYPMVLDPFAGVGGIHALGEWGYNTIGIEIEPEWAYQHPQTTLGSALELPFLDGTFDAIVTSPCYGNRMADHHEARDASRRNTYRHALGHPLKPDNAGAMQWGVEYQMFHRRAWAQANRVLRPGGLAIINVKNHKRKGAEQHVAEFHLRAWFEFGHRLEHAERIATPGNRYGANGNMRVDGEMLMVVRKP